jgi:predicted nucleic acid-binding Zn ribbon protein
VSDPAASPDAVNHTLPIVCVECKVIYKRIEVVRVVEDWEVSHGMCPACLAKLDAKLFNRAAPGVEALR